MSDHSLGRMLPTRLEIASTAFVAPNAVLVGEVSVGEESSVWYHTVLRGDMEPIRIGNRSNVQDGTVIHVDAEHATLIGDDVTVGHSAVIHGATLERGCLIGMGAIVLSGAKVGEGAVIAAGAVVREGFEVPPRTLVAGVPGKIIRELDEEMCARFSTNKDHYVVYGREYLAERLGGGPHGGR